MKDDVVIILLTHSSYIDVCNLFFKLYEKNFGNYELIISYYGSKVNFHNYISIYNGENSTLPECLYNVSKIIKKNIYISLLGDAFINSKINIEKIEDLIKIMIDKKIVYCNLIPKVKFFKKKQQFSFIKSNDLYFHSFIAFACTENFINQEFGNNITDLEFEEKYLKETMSTEKKIYCNRIILNENIFNIIPGIEKGKWNRIAYRKIKRSNEEFNLHFREKQSVLMSIKSEFLNLLILYLNPKVRFFLKKYIGIFLRFASKF